MDFAELASRISSLVEYLPGKVRTQVSLELTPEEYDSLSFDKTVGTNFIDSADKWQVSSSEQKTGTLRMYRLKDVYRDGNFSIYVTTYKEVPIPE